ncbi:MOP flippase family protein [Sphingomonas citri]|nr:MOP flippase family protein [Sphingomonas citri]
MELKAKTMKAVKWNFVSTAIGAFVGLLQLWLLARILPPHEYGVISLALMIITFFNIFIDFGISNSIIRHGHITELELSSLYTINIGLGLVTFVVAFVSSPLLSHFFKSPELTTQLQIMSLVFLFVPFGQQQRAILSRELRFDFVAIVSIITLLTNCVLVIALAVIFKKAWVASVAFFVSTTLGCVIFFAHSLRERRPSFTFSWPAARPHIRYSVQLVLDSLINVVSVNTYPALMARMVSLTAIGGYNISYGISINLIERLKPVLVQALFPAFAKIQDDETKLTRNFLLVTSYGMLVNLPLLAGMFVCSSLVVQVFFKPEWQFIAVLVKILCLVGMVRSIDPPVISLLLVKAKMHLNVRMGVAKLLIGIVLAIVLGQRYGIVGIASSFLIVQLLNTIASYFFLVRACVVGVGRQYLINVLIPFAQTLPIFIGAGAVVVMAPTPWPAVNLALSVVVGALGYALGLWFSPFALVRGFVLLAANGLSAKLGGHASRAMRAS